MEDRLTFDEIVDGAVERLLDGEDVDAVLASFPEHAAELAPIVRSAEMLVNVPAYDAGPAPRVQAMRRMLDQVEASAVGTGSGGGIMSIFKSLRGRPLAFQGAAIGGALVLFGALGLGASAATGNTPEPVREFLGISSSSTIRVELEGTIVSVEPSTSTLTISANGDIRTVVVTGDTELSLGGDAIALTDLAAGQQVEVKGSLEPDNSIVATRVHVEDDDEDDDGIPTAAPSTPGADVPAAVPTSDDRDDDDEDDDGEDNNSGSGSGDDDLDDDNSGPDSGDADDDGIEGGNSGPGSGDDDDGIDDNSGSGGGDGEDDTDDDDSGHSSDDAEDDSSGSGGGDDGGDD